MDILEGPVEWVPGRSQLPWHCGMFAVFVASLLLAETMLNFGLSWAGIVVNSARLTLIVQLVAIGLAADPLMLWVLFVPMPAPRLGLSPRGVTFEAGLGTHYVPWEGAYLRAGRSEILVRRSGLWIAYSVTPLQKRRIELIRSTTS